MTPRTPKRPDLPFGRGQIFPAEAAQDRFENCACADCDKHGLPHLVNNASELYWEHHPGIGGRTKCTRYGTGYGDSIKDGSLPPEPMWFSPDDFTRRATAPSPTRSDCHLPDIQHGLIAVIKGDDPDKVNIQHFCGYAAPPTKDDLESLRGELETDPEFGLVGIDFILTAAPPEVIEHYKGL